MSIEFRLMTNVTASNVCGIFNNLENIKLSFILDFKSGPEKHAKLMLMLSSYKQRFHLEILPTWDIFVTFNNTMITKGCVADTIQALLIRHHQF